MNGPRSFGRRYVVTWDDEVGRYHVTLGKESIGFHRTPEGAGALVREHVQRVSVTPLMPPYSVVFVAREDEFPAA
jgi:hypothetical protein